jgi:aspartyl-tRNA(Asn)/glutamyl-tRNA(Gln) amidotransferase subunit C
MCSEEGTVKIDRKEVEHVAELARLQFDDAQLEVFAHQLNTILEYFDKLQEVDTSNIEPTSHAVAIKNVFRDDKAVGFPDKDLLLKNAPSQEKDCFKVPKVIE